MTEKAASTQDTAAMIGQLRQATNDLLDRHNRIHHAFIPVVEMQISLTDELRSILMERHAPAVGGNVNDGQLCFLDGEIRPFSRHFLRLLVDDDKDAVLVSSSIDRIKHNLKSGVRVDVNELPSMQGWHSTEIAAVIDHYQRRIGLLRNSLDHIRNTLKRLLAVRAALPEGLRVFLEEKATHYSEWDFLVRPRLEVIGRGGQTALVDPRKPMMSLHWWYPIIGLQAVRIDEAISTLKRETTFV